MNDNKLNIYVFTFGTGQLKNFNIIDPNSVALIVAAKTENEARQIVFDDPDIGSQFCTSYSFASFSKQFQNYRMEMLDLDMLKERKINA